MPAGNANFSIECAYPYWRYSDSKGETDLFFEIGSSENNGLWLQREASKHPEGATPEELALDRVIGHLKSVGYTLQFYDDDQQNSVDRREFIQAHEKSGYSAQENPDGTITVARGDHPDASGLIARLKRLFCGR